MGRFETIEGPKMAKEHHEDPKDPKRAQKHTNVAGKEFKSGPPIFPKLSEEDSKRTFEKKNKKKSLLAIKLLFRMDGI